MSDQVVPTGPITLDLGAVSDDPPAVGWHTVEIERADFGVSSKKGLPKVFVLSRVIDEADPDYGRTIIWNLMLAGQGLVFTKRCFAALGFEGDTLTFPSGEALAEALMGLQVDVRVKHRLYEGAKQAQVNNWRKYEPISY